ncbi:unnamed protein product [Oikopleura dioica]|nr:unnamed protein product [Oikopleura dioica]
MIGMASISYFRGCDPVKSGKITRIDAIVPFLVQEIFKEIPGMTGVFISSAYSATLSTISTALNSGATIFFTSIIGNVEIKEEKRIFYMRIFITSKFIYYFRKRVSLVFGVFVTFMSMLFIYMPGNIIGIALMVLGSFQAPLTMIFLLGILVPSTNEYGIIAGTIASQIPLVLLSLQKMFFHKPASFQNLVHHTADVCMNVSSISVLLEPVPELVDPSYPWWHRIFWVSKVGWNGFLAMAIMAVVSCVVSRIFKSKTKEPNPKLHLSLFTSKKWPSFMRNAFLLECHKNVQTEEVKILTDEKDF